MPAGRLPCGRCGRGSGGQNFTTETFRWDSGIYTDLGTLGGTLSEPHGIDDSGRVTGFAYTSGGGIHAFRSTGNTLTDIDSLGGGYSLGYAIDASGDVVGQAYGADQLYHAFLWPGSGTMHDLLGPAGGSQSEADSISRSGQYIAGRAPGGGFLWHAGQVTSLGTISQANSVNDAGQVVGTFIVGQYDRAYVWDAAHGMRDLTTLIDPAARASWTLLGEATGINDQGLIVGSGTYNGVETAYLLTPIPEPTFGALAAAALCTLLRRRPRVRQMPNPCR